MEDEKVDIETQTVHYWVCPACDQENTIDIDYNITVTCHCGAEYEVNRRILPW